MPIDSVVRRHVDARIVSYAIELLKDKEAAHELQMTLAGCATAALQAASGLVALTIACKAASCSPMLSQLMGGKQSTHAQMLLESLGETLKECWYTDIKEVLELIIVLAAESSENSEEEFRYRHWAQALMLDTRALAIVDDEVQADIEIDQEPEHKRLRHRKPRSSKDSYERERLENLVARAVALGVAVTKPLLTNGHVIVVGDGATGQARLLKLRGSVSAAQLLCDAANDEIKKMSLAEPTY